MPKSSVQLFIDYKSPYAYLAVAPAYQLAADTGIDIDWLPYTLDIPSYLGSAKVDAAGNVLEEARNAHQWRRVKYSYMDCRREANRRGLTIRGPKKIFDSSLAHIGLLWAKRHGHWRAYNDRVFERFWKRELDIEDTDALTTLLAECGIPSQGFTAFAAGDGRVELDAIQQGAEAAGVFGVPSILIDGQDLYWGREHFERVRELLAATRPQRSDAPQC